MDPSRRRHLANAAYSSVDLYVEYAVTFAVSIVVARSLGPGGYGTWTLMLWIGSVGIVLANHGLPTGVMKFVGEARGRADDRLADRLLLRLERTQLASSLAVAVLLALVILVLPRRLVDDVAARGLLWLVLPAVVFRSLYVYYFSAAKGFEDFRLTAWVKLVVGPLYLALIAAAALSGAGLAGFLGAWMSGCVLYAAAMRTALVRDRRPGEEPVVAPALLARVGRHVRYASAIVVLDLLILRQTEIFFLQLYSTPEAVGFYGLGRSLAASAVLLIPGVFTALLLPAMSRASGRDPTLLAPGFLSATRYIVLLAVPVVALCEVFAADLVTLLYGGAYGPAVLVFRVAVLAGAVGVVSASASSYQLSTDRQPVVVGIMLAAAAATLALDVLLIPPFELAGAIVAGATGAVLLAMGLLVHAYRALGVRPELGIHARAIAAGAAATLPALAARLLLPPWLAIPVGSAALAGSYVALSLALGAWTDDDVGFLADLARAHPSRWTNRLAAVLDRSGGAHRTARADRRGGDGR